MRHRIGTPVGEPDGERAPFLDPGFQLLARHDARFFSLPALSSWAVSPETLFGDAALPIMILSLNGCSTPPVKTILPALFAFFLLLETGYATTIDGTQLADGRRPDRPFPKAFAEATKALGNDAPKYACTMVRAITSASGGGWRFDFGSKERKSVVLQIQYNGTSSRWPCGEVMNEFPPAPLLSILEALAVADALVQRRLRGFFFTGADWHATDGTWRIFFSNPSASWTFVDVDPSRSAKLDSVNRRSR